MIDLARTGTALANLVHDASAEQLPDLAGLLEATRVRILARLQSSPASGWPGALVDAATVAATFGVPKSQIYEQARQGRLPCIELGKYRRFDLDAVRAALSVTRGTESPAFGTRKKRNKDAGKRASATALLPL